MAREIVLENDGVEYAEGLGWLVKKMQFIGQRGCPDRWFFRKGVLLIIEFKKRGEKPDGIQLKRHDELRGKGFKVHVIDNFEDFKKLIDANTN